MEDGDSRLRTDPIRADAGEAMTDEMYSQSSCLTSPLLIEVREIDGARN